MKARRFRQGFIARQLRSLRSGRKVGGSRHDDGMAVVETYAEASVKDHGRGTGWVGVDGRVTGAAQPSLQNRSLVAVKQMTATCCCHELEEAEMGTLPSRRRLRLRVKRHEQLAANLVLVGRLGFA